MNLPSPTNPCFHLRRQVYPRYPAEASPADRLAPELTVKVAFFVGADGAVQGSYVLESDAGPTFAAVVLEAVDHWLYDPDFTSCADPAGFCAGRTRYHLLPHNSYAGFGRLPPASKVRAGDYVLILAPFTGASYDPEQRMLQFKEGKLPVERLHTAARGALFRVREE